MIEITEAPIDHHALTERVRRPGGAVHVPRDGAAR